MNTRTKTILKTSITEYKKAGILNQAKLLNHVKSELKRHGDAVQSIGIGLDEDMVTAAKIFLRIYNRPPVNLSITIDGYKVRARERLNTHLNYNISLIVFTPEGRIKGGHQLKRGTSITDITAAAISIIKSKPAIIAGLN